MAKHWTVFVVIEVVTQTPESIPLEYDIYNAIRVNKSPVVPRSTQACVVELIWRFPPLVFHLHTRASVEEGWGALEASRFADPPYARTRVIFVGGELRKTIKCGTRRALHREFLSI